METFTVRDLDRTPAKVLAAADRDGVVRIRSRTGRSYALRPEAPAEVDWSRYVKQQKDWMQQQFASPAVEPAAIASIDRMIAGDESVL